jgi:hypothetical protein
MTEMNARYTVVIETSYRPGEDLPDHYEFVRSGLTGDEAYDLEIKLNSQEPTRARPTQTVIVVTDEEAAAGGYRRAS